MKVPEAFYKYLLQKDLKPNNDIMNRTITYFFSLALVLIGWATKAQTYAELQSVDDNYGTVTALTSTDVTVTSAGFRGNAGDYNGRYAIVSNGLYFFTASDDTNGDELWVTDGTQAGTQMVKDIFPGSEGSAPANLAVANGLVYFAATTSDQGTELWVSDGTEAGTNIVLDLFEGTGNANPNTITPFLNGILFAAVDVSSSDYDGDGVARQQIWFSDGTAEGTLRLSANNRNGVQPKTSGMDADERLSHFQLIGDTLAIFGGTSEREVPGGILGEEIWVTNGTPEPWGTKMLLDINPPTDNSNIQWLFAANEGQALFRSKTPGKWNGQDDLVHLENEYWVTDGSPKGTYLLQDLNALPGNEANTTGNTGSAFPINFDGKIYYRASVDVANELYRMNSLSGDGENLELAADIAPFFDGAERNSFIDDPILFDEKLFLKADFRSATDIYERVGQELGAFDPVSDTIVMVADIFTGATFNSFPRNKTIVNGRMYFTANDASDQASHDVWALDILGDDSDPTVPETDNRSNLDRYAVYKVYDDVDGFNQQFPSDLRELNGNLIYRTIEGTLAVFDDGLTKSGEAYEDPRDQGLPVEVGSNQYLDAPPLVVFNAPEKLEWVEGDDIPLTVTVTDPEGVGIEKVEYYQGDFFNTWELLGTSTQGDFSFTWEGVSADPDPYTITALAYDANDSAFSMPIRLLVQGNQPPSVSLTLPASDAEFTTEETVEVAAEASDDNAAGYVKVEFFANDELIFTDEESPYGLEWTAPTTEGAYAIKAIATDNLGAQSESNVRNITVVAPLSADLRDENVSIFPVPVVDGEVSIISKQPLQGTIKVTDIAGRVMLERPTSENVNKLDVSSLLSGIYLLKFRTVGNETIIRRIVID